jgi:hypothetical protein
MIIEQRHQKRRTGFCLAGYETGALIERQIGNHRSRK